MQIWEKDGLRFGEGVPKICVPLTERELPQLLSQAEAVKKLPADLVEWRLDCYKGDPCKVLPLLREALEEKPLLCTLRTEKEGGKASLTLEEYQRQMSSLLEIGGFSFLDIEFSWGVVCVKELVQLANSRKVGTVVSKHDFHRTPPQKEIEETLRQMKALGADLPKYAVTPKTPEDVLVLLSATYQVSRELGPIITMSMGELGKVSRVSGEVFGSCVTFGAGAKASAPGQLNALRLGAVLEDLHWKKNGPLEKE